MNTPVVQYAVEFNQKLLSSVASTSRRLARIAGEGATKAFTVARDTGAVVVGQTRSATQRTVDELTANTKEVVGQARAQGRRGAAEIDDVADSTARRAVDAVDDGPSSGTPYEQWSKADLYERAQELDIEGRSAMSKRELIAALRAA